MNNIGAILKAANDYVEIKAYKALLKAAERHMNELNNHPQLGAYSPIFLSALKTYNEMLDRHDLMVEALYKD